MTSKDKYHYYKTTIRPNIPGLIVSYNHSTGLLALKEEYPLKNYLGYVTESEANEKLERKKVGIKKMSSVNQFRGSR